MSASAINLESKPIYQGMAVAFNGTGVRLTTSTLAATHIAISAGAAGSVTSFTNSGELDLPDWSLATGSKFLTPNAVYYVTSGGKLTKLVTNQVAGYAISTTTMKVLVPAPTSTPTTSATITKPVHGIPADGASGQVLTKQSNDSYDASWRSIPTIVVSLATCSDVALTDLQDGDTLKYDLVSGKWVNVHAPVS